MSVVETLFWCITVPGLYLVISCLVYVIYRKTIYKHEDPSLAKAAAAIWPFSAPFFLVIGGIVWVFNSLFDMIDERGGRNE